MPHANPLGKKVFQAALLICLWSIPFFVLAEIGLRRIIPPPMSIPVIADCESSRLYGWGFAPHSPVPTRNPDTGEVFVEKANSRGWKDIEHPFNKRDDTFRILIVGDSVTQGMPALQDVYHRVLEDLLRSEGYRVEVIALGVGGWSTDQEFLAYQCEGKKYSPNLVISQFTHNDIEGLAGGKSKLFDDFLKPFVFTVEAGDLKIQKRERYAAEPQLSGRLDRWFIVHSRSYFFGRNLYLRHLASSERKDELRNRLLTNLDPSDAGFHSVGDDTPSQKQVWQLYRAILAKWKSECEAQGSSLVTFTECCDEGELRFGLQWYLKQEGGKTLRKLSDGSWTEIDFEKPRRRWCEVCQELGVEQIPNQSFIERYKYDAHPNVAGNSAMAKDIRNYLLGHPLYSKELDSFREKAPEGIALAASQ